MSERISITESELVRALRAETAIDDDAPADAETVSDLCARLSLGPNAIAKRLAKYRAQGRLEEYCVVRCDTQGRPHRMRAYVLLPDTKGQAKLKRA